MARAGVPYEEVDYEFTGELTDAEKAVRSMASAAMSSGAQSAKKQPDHGMLRTSLARGRSGSKVRL